MAKLTTLIRRFMRTKLGTIFILLISVAVGLFVVNYAGGLLGKSGSSTVVSSGGDFGDSPLGGRGLAGFEPGHAGRSQGARRRHRDGSRMQVCRVPRLTLESDTNKEAYHDMPPLQCPGEKLFYIRMGNLYINHTVLAGRKLEKCEFSSIEWMSDHFHTYSKTYTRKHEPFDIKVNHDFFRIQCYLDPAHKAKKEENKDTVDYHARRLLQANDVPGQAKSNDGDLVHRNSPKLVGSFGVPDLADNVLRNQLQNSRPRKAQAQVETQGKIGKPQTDNQAVRGQSQLDTQAKIAQPDILAKLGKPQIDSQANKGQSQLNTQAKIAQSDILAKLGKPLLDIPANIAPQQSDTRSQNAQPQEQGLNKNPSLKQGKTQAVVDEDKEINGAKLPQKSLKANAEAGNDDVDKQNPEAAEDEEVEEAKVQSDEDANANASENLDEDPPGENDNDLENEEHYNAGGEMDYHFEGQDPPDFDQFVSQIHVKEEVQERLKQVKPSKHLLGMNVLIFALDSMSHLSYQRKLPKTYSYLKEVLNAVIMNGYNIVGDATVANILPLLTGRSQTELPETRVNKESSHFVNILPFIWNKYEQNGYVTQYAEDQPSLGTFQLRHNGFEEPPVDHYMRPFWLAMADAELHRNSPQYCLGSEPEHMYMLNYLKMFFMRYRNFPKFSFGFMGELSHDDNNPAEYIDKDMVDFLEFLRTTQALENTLLIVMGDHGARYSKVRGTVQGKLEERLPFMSLSFPQWFQDKYPELYTNLKRNRMKLTTPFDVHETLRDLIDIKRTELTVRYSDRGISLLKAIPRNRTCESAGIDLHWCSCLQSEAMEITEPVIQGAAKLLLQHINELTAPHRDLCEELGLQDILDARIVIPNEQVLKFQKSIDPDQRVANFSKQYKLDLVHHQVIIETSPNGAQFEGTVQLNVRENKHYITGEVSRINAYGSQAGCVVKTQPQLRKFCLCKQEQSMAKVKKVNKKNR